MMHEQWFVGVQQRCFVEGGDASWTNAAMWHGDYGLKRRYAPSKEEALRILKHARELWSGDERMQIVRYVIKKRMVSDWEIEEGDDE